MKLYICPICGKALATDFSLFPDIKAWCYTYDCEIIPLATPQEVSTEVKDATG